MNTRHSACRAFQYQLARPIRSFSAATDRFGGIYGTHSCSQLAEAIKIYQEIIATANRLTATSQSAPKLCSLMFLAAVDGDCVALTDVDVDVDVDD
jgi:hypothetical protein